MTFCNPKFCIMKLIRKQMNVEFPSIEPSEIQLQNEFQSELIYEFKIHKSKKKL